MPNTYDESNPKFSVETNARRVYLMAKSLIGQHLSGDNAMLGCATTVNNIVQRALGAPIGGGASTAAMYQVLKTDPRFESVTDPLAGDIVISPTGTSGWGPQQHGHCGIVMEYGICSNSSEDGTLHENYTIASWNDFFGRAFKFPVYYFRFVDGGHD